MAKNINEGMHVGDLEQLVRKTLSIDEYESKIDDRSIVVGFAVDDDEPGKDLVRFIERGTIEVLDAEVSPGPKPNGDYMVFVEFIRDDKFPKSLIDLLRSVEHLISRPVKEWTFTVYGHEGEISMSEKNLTKYVRLENKKESTKESIENYIKDSSLDNFLVENDMLYIQRGNYSNAFKIMGYGNFEDISKIYNLEKTPISLTEETLAETNDLSRKFGYNWSFNSLGQYILAQNATSDHILLLKKAID